MAFTPTEEAQLRAVITAFESGKTISEIAASTEVFTTDVLEVVQSAVSKKATIAQIVTLVNSQLGIAAISSKLSGIEAGAQVNTIESIVAGTNVTIDITDPNKPVINVPVVNGEDGRGIVSNDKTSTNGLVDTYTITYTDGSTSTYDVVNGTVGADGTSAPINVTVFKQGANGVAYPQKFKWITDLTVTSIQLNDCTAISFSIGANNYTHETLVGVTIPAGTQLIFNDLTIIAGENSANVIIIF